MRSLRTPVLPLLIALTLTMSVTVPIRIAYAGVAGKCAVVATDWLESLDRDVRDRGALAFADTRRTWSVRPGAKRREQGLALADMTDRQRVLAHELINCGLSSGGYLKANAVMRLDNVVAANLGEIVFSGSRPVEIGRLYYWLAVFGDPSGAAPWGWQLEGHHLGLNFTAVDGELAVTPAFYGADPAEIDSGELSGQRLLTGERDRAFDLLASLDDAQRERAVIADEVPRGIFTVPGKGDAVTGFEGLPAGDMTAKQRQLLWLLIDEYLQNVAPEAADRLTAGILQAGSERVYFAWMGPGARGSPIYYRVHGPAILIEFDHSANIRSRSLEPDPNHVHSILRVPGDDFGDDLLRRHYAESPGHRPAGSAGDSQ